MSRHRFPLLLVALLATTLFLPALVKREVFTLRDHFDYFQPLRWFTAQELQAGRLPLWNPYSASGEPWLANPQTGVFYPPAWLFLVLPFETAYMLFLLLHLIVLGWGAYLLFARNAPQGAALAGAAAVMFSGPVLSLLDVQNNFTTFAWIPLALWCAAEGAWRRGGVVLALAFLGAEPFFAAVAAGLYVIVGVPRRLIGPVGLIGPIGPIGPMNSEEPRNWSGVLTSALIAIGLSAVQLLPFLEFARSSDRAGGMDDGLILRDSMAWRDWLQIAVPGGATPSQQFIPVVYVGIVICLLALIGLTTIRTRRDSRGWVALLVFAIVIATGPAMLTRLPLTLFRYPARLVPFAALAIAALAVAGWQRVRRDRRWIDLLLVMVIVADLLPRAMPLLGTAPFRTDVVPWSKAVGASAKVLRFGDIDPNRRTLWMSGYLNLYERRFDTWTAAPLASSAYVAMHRRLLVQPKFEEFAYAGVAFMLTRYALPWPWMPVSSIGGVHLFRNPDAYPMAAHVAPGARSMRRAPWTLDTAHARLTVNAPTDGVVVLRQQAARGWRVTLDGRPAEPLVIDGIFRGVNVTKGRHDIVWTYRPASLLLGAILTIITLLALQLSVFVKRRKSV